MKFIHHIAFHATRAQLHELESLGIKFPPGREELVEPERFVGFDIAEDHPNWLLLCALLRQWGDKFGYVRTEFTRQEIESARWLQLAAWGNGYPQPQDLEGYVRVTYDLTRACMKCMHGAVQNAPFRIKCEPKWNRRGIMTLLWVHDEFFVPPAVWDTVFKPFGIGCRVVANRKGVELKTVVQLVVDEEVDVVTEGLTPIHCDACGRDKYQWVTRGMFPALVKEPVAAMAKTKQLFGDGWGVRGVVISQELIRALMAHKVRGAELKPVDAALPALVA